MTDTTVRAFRRGDREQLTALVNAHVRAVVPGLGVSVHSLLGRLEHEPGEFVVDPWVVERVTLVGEQRGRVAAAAHLLRYGDDDAVGHDYRGAGEIRWLLCWPPAPYAPDSQRAGDAVAAAAVAYLRRQGVRRLFADGALPAPGVYGVPVPWPHVREVLRGAGFVAGDRTEIVLLADVAALQRVPPPLSGLHAERTLGVNGTRLSAVRAGERLGYVEVDVLLGDVGRIAGTDGWADVGNLWVEEAHRRRGVATWLLGQAAEWLRLGHVDRLLDYSTPDEPGHLAFLRHVGFVELSRTLRGWEHPTPGGVLPQSRSR